MYKFHWIGTARGLTGGRITLCSVWLFRVLLLRIPFTHSVSSNQAARPQRRQGPWQGSRSQAPPSSSCCCPFAIFLIIITSPREKAGNRKRRGTESVNFVTFGTTEAGKKPVKRMVVFSRLELSYQEESRWWQGPPGGVRVEAALLIHWAQQAHKDVEEYSRQVNSPVRRYEWKVHRSQL